MNPTVIQPYQVYHQETSDKYKKTHIAFRYIPYRGKVNKNAAKWTDKGKRAAERRDRKLWNRIPCGSKFSVGI